MSHSDKTTDEQLGNPEIETPEVENPELNAEGDVDNTQPDETTAGESEMTMDDLREELEKVQAKSDEYADTILRMRAESENQRRRSDKQVEDAHKYAVKKFIEELLPVADSMEMGMAAEGNIEQIREGIGLTMKVFENAMEKFSVEAVNPLGEKFNPDLHQAMAMQPSEEYEDGHVSAVMQKGYTLSGRIVRPAMVMVVKN